MPPFKFDPNGGHLIENKSRGSGKRGYRMSTNGLYVPFGPALDIGARSIPQSITSGTLKLWLDANSGVTSAGGTGTPTTPGDTTWDGSTNVTFSGTGNRTLTKNSSGNAWDSGAYNTSQPIYAYGYVQGRFTGGNDSGLGLNSDPATNYNYNTVDYLLYQSGNTLTMFANGGSVGSAGTFNAADVLRLVADGRTVSVWKQTNGTGSFAWVCDFPNARTTAPLYADHILHTGTGGGSPSQISDIAIYVAPSVSALGDQSGTGYSAGMSVAARRPALITGRRNGLSGLRFQRNVGAESCLTIPNFALSTSFTAFVVCEDLSTGGGVRPVFIEHGPEIDWANGFMINPATAGGDANIMGVRRSTNSMPQYSGGSPWGASVNAGYATFQYKASTQTFTVRKNGSALTLGANSPGAPSSTESVVTAALNIGTRNAAGESSTPSVTQYSLPCMDSYLYEVLIYEGALTLADIQTVESTYIANRWSM